jgi:uncharacterized protein
MISSTERSVAYNETADEGMPTAKESPPGPWPSSKACAEHFWSTCDARAMEMQRCGDCGRLRYPAAPSCRSCGSPSFTWAPVSGEATVYSYSVVERGAPGFAADAPYVFALVELDDGPVIATRLVAVSPEEAAIGLRVHVHYEASEGQRALPYFTVARKSRER